LKIYPLPQALEVETETPSHKASSVWARWQASYQRIALNLFVVMLRQPQTTPFLPHFPLKSQSTFKFSTSQKYA
jgi:hypothetical protein